MLALHRIDDINWSLFEDGKDTGYRWQICVPYRPHYEFEGVNDYSQWCMASFTEFGDLR